MTQKIKDGYVSASKKIGTSQDITSNKSLQPQNITQSYYYVAELYDTISLAKNIIDVPINDAFKEGRTLADENLKVSDFYRVNDRVISLAMKSARVFGGCYIYLEDGGEPNAELLKEKILSLKKIELQDITNYGTMDLNPLSDNYLKHEDIRVTASNIEIHKSRLLYLDGESCTDERRKLLNGYGLSTFERISTDIQNVDISMNRGLNILETLSQDVISVEGLNESLKDTGSETEIVDRLTAMNQIKSIMSTLVIDGEDKYFNVNRSLSGVTDIITEAKEMLCSASRIPYSKLFGKANTGLNATGNNEVRNYYDEVSSSIQEGKIRDIYNSIDEALTGAVLEFEFNPLYTPTALEVAETANQESDATTKKVNSVIALMQNGLIEDDEAKELLKPVL
jgi:phage-related protein (TIGR01555 family)